MVEYDTHDFSGRFDPNKIPEYAALIEQGYTLLTNATERVVEKISKEQKENGLEVFLYKNAYFNGVPDCTLTAIFVRKPKEDIAETEG